MMIKLWLALVGYVVFFIFGMLVMDKIHKKVNTLRIQIDAPEIPDEEVDEIMNKILEKMNNGKKN